MKNELSSELASHLRSNNTGKVRKICEQFTIDTEVETFQEFISKKMSDGGYTREDLARFLGYSKSDSKKKAETLKKTINTVGYTTNRDRIIAICIALSLKLNETNKALTLYNMLPLNWNKDRERIIITAINEMVDLNETNRWLSLAGKPILSIEKTPHNKTPLVIRRPKRKFEIIENPSAVCGDYIGENSLYGRYNPGTYICKAEMKVKAKNGTIYKLTAEDNGYYEIEYQGRDGLPKNKTFESLDECMKNEFKDYFILLEYTARQEVQKVLNILNDTRNYITRTDAAFSDDSLLFFAETFNYDDPELSEYYQMEYCNGTYLMYKTHHSIFMKHHLENQYETYYIKNNSDQPKPISYPPEFNANCTKSDQRQNEKNAKLFSRLKEAIDDTIKRVKSHAIPIYDPYEISGDLFYDLAEIYKIKDKFTWKTEEWYNIAAEDSCEAITSDGTKFTLTLSDMKRAFELAIPTIDAIYKVIQKHGSISNII